MGQLLDLHELFPKHVIHGHTNPAAGSRGVLLELRYDFVADLCVNGDSPSDRDSHQIHEEEQKR